MNESLSIFDKHQLKIAKDTLRMSDAGANIIGGMTKQEAKEFLYDHGFYKFPSLPVQTTHWNKQAWINYIDKEGEWK